MAFSYLLCYGRGERGKGKEGKKWEIKKVENFGSSRFKNPFSHSPLPTPHSPLPNPQFLI